MYVTVNVDRVKKITEAAILVLVDGELIWLPKSQIEDPDGFEAGDVDVEMSVTDWIHRQKFLV